MTAVCDNAVTPRRSCVDVPMKLSPFLKRGMGMMMFFITVLASQ